MRQKGQRSSHRDTVLLSGWVYADLLLGLMMLFLVSTRGVPVDQLQPTITPTSTWTPTATQTSTATRPVAIGPTSTRTPTLTPTASRTPSPTPTLTPTLTPQPPAIGVNQTAYTVVLRVNPDRLPAFFAGDAKAKQQTQVQLTEQIRTCFGAFPGKAKAGFLLAFGGNPLPARGEALAQTATELLRQLYPDLFSGIPIRNYHTITTNPYENGIIELQTHFITQPGLLDVVTSYGEECVIPPASWCEGNGEAQIVVFNWDSEPLKFILNGTSREVRMAKGDNPSYACIRSVAGKASWGATLRALNAQGSLNLAKGKTEYLYFCVEDGRLVQNCRSGSKVEGTSGK